MMLLLEKRWEFVIFVIVDYRYSKIEHKLLNSFAKIGCFICYIFDFNGVCTDSYFELDTFNLASRVSLLDVET